jgi:hypothetical protein
MADDFLAPACGDQAADGEADEQGEAVIAAIVSVSVQREMGFMRRRLAPCDLAGFLNPAD